MIARLVSKLGYAITASAGLVLMPLLENDPSPEFVSIAIRVYDLPAMERFYHEGLGFGFEDATIGTLTYRHGQLHGIGLKLVPIREHQDHVGFPVHQPGFAVPDIEFVIALASELGGGVVGEVQRRGGKVVRAAVRDPDGNTIELERKAK